MAKKILGRRQGPLGLRFVDVTKQDISQDKMVLFEAPPDSLITGDHRGRVSLDQLYPVENVVTIGSNLHLRTSFGLRGLQSKAKRVESFTPLLWRKFIDCADIPDGFRNAGLKYAGFIASGRNSWCLPTWIWTSAACVRYLCSVGDIQKASLLGEALLSRQEAEGGWIVRSDYTGIGEIPVVAPNDSAYIANNACLELYNKTGADRYKQAAKRCADWIMDSARPDGVVWTGYNRKTGRWLKDHTIVDTGFTAGLFANLYSITGDCRYFTFLERFVNRFVELFYDPQTKCFATSIDAKDRRTGGRFARGQAWALEGLIPAYKVLRTERLRDIIQANVERIVSHQLSNGGWSYNFDKAYLGEDCKGVPVLTKALLDWHQIQGDPRLTASAVRALNWCIARTSLSGASLGGIFSFNFEGAVVHNFYTKTAFVYSSAYALESLQLLSENGKSNSGG